MIEADIMVTEESTEDDDINLTNSEELRVPGYGIPDGGAGLSGIGVETLQNWEEYYASLGMQPFHEDAGRDVQCTFGNSSDASSQGTTLFPFGIGQMKKKKDQLLHFNSNTHKSSKINIGSSLIQMILLN